MADDENASQAVRKRYWVIHPGRIDGRNYVHGEGVDLTVADAARFREDGIGLSFVKPEPLERARSAE